MRTIQLFEQYQTKTGEEITFTTHQHERYAGAPIYVLYEITARVDGQEAGYIKISYVPYENYQKYVGTIFHYAGLQGNMELKRGLSSATKISELTNEDINKIVKAYGANIRPNPREREMNELPIEEKRELVKGEIKKYFEKWYKERYERWKQFHVDKPQVDYIRVYDEWKRQGIALALYLYGARWCQERGLHLWSSDLQEPEAASAWQKMAALGWAHESNGRYYISI